MTIPVEAIGAAADALTDRYGIIPRLTAVGDARVAIEAAMPAIREALAQEIEARSGGDYPDTVSDPLMYAARIIREGIR